MKSTLLFKAADATTYKYEIYQKNDGSGFYAEIFRKDKFMEMYVWVVIDEINISTHDYIVQYAEDEATEHFSDNYLNK
ncbi:hypothetical protein ACWXWE_13140 [Pantoea ananatis]